MKQEMEEERLDKKDDIEEEHPYQTMIINHFEKITVNINASQMEQWSISIVRKLPIISRILDILQQIQGIQLQQNECIS